MTLYGWGLIEPDHCPRKRQLNHRQTGGITATEVQKTANGWSREAAGGASLPPVIGRSSLHACRTVSVACPCRHRSEACHVSGPKQIWGPIRGLWGTAGSCYFSKISSDSRDDLPRQAHSRQIHIPLFLLSPFSFSSLLPPPQDSMLAKWVTGFMTSVT